MDEPTRRKLNLLLHLANIDGKFHQSERRLIEEFVKDKGFDLNEFYFISEEKIVNDLIEEKAETLFLSIKLIQADQVIDKRELSFCKDLASKLGFNPSIVDAYANKDFSRTDFDDDIANWMA